VFCSASTQALDLVRSYGLKGIVGMLSCVDPEILTRRLRELKDHPALLAWYTNDEMPPGLAPRQAMLQEVYRREDPHHPTFTVLDKPWQVRIFMPTFDVIGMDPYPIGNHRGGIETAYGWGASCARQCFGMRPMWQVPQSFNWRWYRKGPDEPEFRFPTPEEFRSMTWQAIAAGANGLMYYSFGSMRRQFKPDDFAYHWTYVKAVVDEVAKYIPILLSDGLPPNVEGATAAVPVRTWRQGGKTWILAVNTLRKPERVTLTVDSAPSRAVALFGPEPTLADGGRLTLSFGPLDCAMMVLE
jgi:hypothetical protein